VTGTADDVADRRVAVVPDRREGYVGGIHRWLLGTVLRLLNSEVNTMLVDSCPGLVVNGILYASTSFRF